jgi:hypothetical protein
MRFIKTTALVLSASIGLAPLAGCESLPGGEKEQGAVIGGVGGAALGALTAPRYYDRYGYYDRDPYYDRVRCVRYSSYSGRCIEWRRY